LIEQKHQPKLIVFQEQKRELKLKLKSDEIDNREYQRLYTPIRQSKDKVRSHIWDIGRKFRDRYFYCGRLKEVYRKRLGRRTIA